VKICTGWQHDLLFGGICSTAQLRACFLWLRVATLYGIALLQVRRWSFPEGVSPFFVPIIRTLNNGNLIPVKDVKGIVCVSVCELRDIC